MHGTGWAKESQLSQVMESRDTSLLKETFRDINDLLRHLHSDLHKGIDPDTIDDRRSMYGSNTLPPPIMKRYLRFLYEAFKERMVILLLIAAGITVSVGIYQTATGVPNAWLEGVAILTAIAIITGVNSINDHRKQSRFRKLNDTNKELRSVKVIRNGVVLQVKVADLVVGDIITVSMGDIMSCDGILLVGNSIRTDESTMTGESRQIDKRGFENVEDGTQHAEESFDPFLYSGTTIVNGNGKAIVILVGERSNEGKMMKDLRVDPPPTPLQVKLSRLAKRLATWGLIVAVVVLIFLIVIYFIKGSPGDILNGLIAVVLVGISIIVMAIPEGLPLAVTLALAYATIHMLKDNNLVRHLNACETMGGATTVCSDKTGTLTVNKMSVVRARVFGKSYVRNDPGMGEDTLVNLSTMKMFPKFSKSIMINTDAYEAEVAGKRIFLGSQTEIALLEWLRLIGSLTETTFDYDTCRAEADIVSRQPFNSERKRSSVTVKGDRGYDVYIKGASEVLLSMCGKYVGPDGHVAPLTEEARKSFENEIAEYARLSLRTICVAYKGVKEVKQTPNDHDEGCCILLGLFGLEDPLRDNAYESVKQCQRAGIVVRMVTGDNAVTAKSIATQCGIISSDDDIVIEGPRFRAMSEDELTDILPRLRVMARSSPNDKLLLVNALIKAKETVAVTGDGANDAPALKNSHVGFSMGVSGTEVAKEASDIVLLDDNFASIVRAILWGRAIYMGIQKFIMFQLSVNVSAVLITIVTAIDTSISTGIPQGGLTTLQILLINLIADSLAALALSTDKPVDAYLDRPPHRRGDHIITGDMWRMIIGQSVYQTAVGLLVYYVGPSIFGGDAATRGTMVYATFVFMVIFNELNCRSVDRDFNIFRGILHNKFFLPLFIVGFLGQFIIVTYLGIIFSTVPISITLWIAAIVIGSGSLAVGALIRVTDRLF